MKRKKAFTLIELLVVISIIALLISILLPALSKAKESAQNIICATNLRTIGQGLFLYANDHDEIIPRSYDPAVQPVWWQYFIARGGYLPQGDVIGSPTNGDAAGIWVCPIAKKDALANGAAQIEITYLRVSNYTFWAGYGTADWSRIADIEGASEQFLAIDGRLDSPQDFATGRVGSLSSEWTRWNLSSNQINDSGTGATGFLHSDSANALHGDFHVEAYKIDAVTRNMCEDPNL